VSAQDEDAAAEAEALRDDEAMRSFRDKVQRLYPPAAGMPTLKVTTGTRVATKRRSGTSGGLGRGSFFRRKTMSPLMVNVYLMSI
jgi:hypothetical protein